MGREVMEPVEDVLVGYACQAGWRVGPGDERGGRGGGHRTLGGVSRDGGGTRLEGTVVIRRDEASG